MVHFCPNCFCVRSSLFQPPSKSNGFRYRGAEPGRLENLSDAVFALAITLLLISSAAPKNFTELRLFVWGLLPFGMSITLIMLIWYEHYLYFLRFGLRTPEIVVFNTAFLILMLFYVYPLKFLFNLILFPLGYLTNDTGLINYLTPQMVDVDMPLLMIIYGLGAASLFSLLSLMYKYALSKKEILQLNNFELFESRGRMHTNALMATVPILSVVLAIIFCYSPYCGMIAGFAYFLYFPVMFIYHHKRMRKTRMWLTDEAEEIGA